MKSNSNWKNLLILCVLSSFFFLTQCQQLTPKQGEYSYVTPEKPWDESFGNHRAVIRVEKNAESARLHFEWRRSDKNVNDRRFVILNSENGDTIRNIQREKVTSEVCDLTFGPVQKGTYYFYYLPYKAQLGHGYFYGNYDKREKAPNKKWLDQSEKPVKAQVLRVESRTTFDSFYPMEIVAHKSEVKEFLQQYKKTFYLFPEDRKYPIRMQKKLPLKWTTELFDGVFQGTAAPNEYYAFQVGVWSPHKTIKNIKYSVSDLISSADTIPSNQITCFNLEGINSKGKPFTKKIDVEEGKIQALWFGVDLAKQQAKGTYLGILTISDDAGIEEKIRIKIKVSGESIVNRGDNEPWRHSRLRWLNSTLGIQDNPVRPYTPMKKVKNDLKCWNRNLRLNPSDALPKQIRATSFELLNRPARFIIETANGRYNLEGKLSFDEETKGHISFHVKAQNKDLQVVTKGRMEYDGWVNYKIQIQAEKNISIKDIRLEFPFSKSATPYFLGAGLVGQKTPYSYLGTWDGYQKEKKVDMVSLPTSKQTKGLWPFDSFWTGSAHVGVHCELRGASYTGPLLNLFRPAYPSSWYNQGKGGFKIQSKGNTNLVTIYSGARQLKKNQEITYDFALLITPVKPINTKKQFNERYYHNISKPIPTKADVKAGVRIINIHHANLYNPFINYPFLASETLKPFVEKWHKNKCKVKLYYTIRELSSSCTEIWALRSLGTEILRGGKGGGFPWCREHLTGNYTPQWYHHFPEGEYPAGITADASILTSEGESRWCNYYVEGLKWLVRELDIDGIYLDDVSFDRKILQRMRYAMDVVKPNCIIDLHSNTGFSKGPANQYATFFPYVDKLWFGESFLYDKMSPENWLVESSGIPFGLMGDMLHAGGNKWLGMQYGMTVRHPWLTDGVICDPRFIWKVWDDFDIEKAQMIGFWEKNSPVLTTNADVKVTVYRHKGKVLLSVGNYSDVAHAIRFKINWKALGLLEEKVQLTAPKIVDFQEERATGPDGTWKLLPRKGFLIYLEERN